MVVTLYGEQNMNVRPLHDRIIESSRFSDSDPRRPSIARIGARGHIGKEPTAGNVKPWLSPRQSRGAFLGS
jgi:hypothetical protein